MKKFKPQKERAGKQPSTLVMAEVRRLEETALEAARERIRGLFFQFDTVVVANSGGKDSSALVELTIEVAREMDCLPVNVVFSDEEAIWNDTVDYMMRQAARPEIRMHWLCLPIRCRNACSRKEPAFYPWHPNEEHLWLRQPPEFAIRELPEFTPEDRQSDVHTNMWNVKKYGNVAVLTGMRAGESIRRRRIYSRAVKEAWKWSEPRGLYRNVITAAPLYDWATSDTWKYLETIGADYNPVYDKLDSIGWGFGSSRIAPLFAEEGIDKLHMVPLIDPRLWDKLQFRVSGAATAARYGTTALYRHEEIVVPETTYEELMHEMLWKWGPEMRKGLQEIITAAIGLHQQTTTRPIPEETPDPVSGCSWKFFCKMVKKGDWKGRLAQTVVLQASQTRKAMGITLEEAFELETQDYE